MAEHKAKTAFEREVEDRFGVLPHFFQSAPDAPEVVEQLWKFARAAYLDSPLPALFKERLFVYLSRFCEVRYCVVRHSAFLIGRGRPAGDASARPMSVDEAVALLGRPFPTSAALDAAFARLGALAGPGAEWPAPGSQLESDIFIVAGVTFLEPGRSDMARQALRSALGPRRLEQLLAYVAFIRTAHFWTLVHPDLTFEDDVEVLLHEHEELARRLLEDPEAGRCDMGERLYDELLMLRRERDELATLKKAREQQDLLIAELSHRVKNTLASVQSMAHQTARDEGTVKSFLRSFNGRLQAMSATHELLAESRWRGAGLEDLLRAECAPYLDAGRGNVRLAGPNLRLRPAAAQILGVVLHELATNAAKHGALALPDGRVSVSWDLEEGAGGESLRLSWRERGGPPVSEPTRRGFGLGVIERGPAHELNGTVRLAFAPEGLECVIVIPVAEALAGLGTAAADR